MVVITPSKDNFVSLKKIIYWCGLIWFSEQILLFEQGTNFLPLCSPVPGEVVLHQSLETCLSRFCYNYNKKNKLGWRKTFWGMITWSNFTWHFHLIKFFGQTPKFKAFDRIIWSTAKIRQFFFVSWSKLLLMSFWVILKFWSTAKICQFFFVSWSKVLIMVFYNFKLLKLSIKWKNPSVLFWHLIESFNNA